MKNLIATSALALVATAGSAFAVTAVGQLNIAGITTVSGDVAGNGTFDLGDTLTIGANIGSGSGSYAGIGNVSGFDLVTAVGPNVGTSFDFGGFTFTIDSTETVTLNDVAFEQFGLGTVTGAGVDASPSSFRFSIAGADQDDDDTLTFSLFISTPPEDMNVVPLPAGLPLLVGGIAALGLLRRRKAA